MASRIPPQTRCIHQFPELFCWRHGTAVAAILNLTSPEENCKRKTDTRVRSMQFLCEVYVFFDFNQNPNVSTMFNKFDTHGSVHHRLLSRNTNMMQLCNRIYYSNDF
jgi:hypothetical protein